MLNFHQHLDMNSDNTIYISEDSLNNVESMNSEKESYSFYPFFPSQTALDKLQAGNAFRLRRVGQWLRTGARYNMNGQDTSEVSSIRS